MKGWPNTKYGLSPSVSQYYHIRDELTVQDGLIFKGEQVLIPATMRKLMKEKIHSSHLGIEGCLRRARECLYWPKMSQEIKDYIQQCEICTTYETTPQKETLESHEIPNRPWQKIGVDLFEWDKKDYLITVDYYSNFWEIDRLYSKTAKTVIKKLKAHFARFGIAEQCISDNGPPFGSAEWIQFSRKWDFEHLTISPGNSKANGKAESAVKMAKRLMTKAKDSNSDPYLALLDYRNTPTQGMNTSPAQRLLDRRARTLIPMTGKLLEARRTNNDDDKAHLQRKQEIQAKYYNRGAKDLPALKKGDAVRMKPFIQGDKQWKKATVTDRLDKRSYLVETDNNRVYRRNRAHLKKRDDSRLGLPPSEPTVNEPAEPDVPSKKPAQECVPPAIRRSDRERRPPNYLKDYVTN